MLIESALSFFAESRSSTSNSTSDSSSPRLRSLGVSPTRDEVEKAMGQLLAQKNYPCIAALKSFHKKDYEIGTYGKFGTGESWQALRRDLLKFVEHQKSTNSIYLTFFAAFAPQDFNEPEFESGLWNELSHLTSLEDLDTDWSDREHADPESKDFRFSLGGTEFFVVGLHTNSSREARRFPFPLLIFNVFDQFEQLERLGLYESMVKTNRERDLKFQGSVNPMVEQHGDAWEPIQFSGQANSSAWKCPFHFLHSASKKK